MIRNVVDTVLSGGEAVRAETALPRERRIGVYDAGLFVVGAVETRVDVSEMLREVVLPEAWFHPLDTFADA